MRVGVIGGGISGMTCAHLLARDGFDVVLLEESDQLGGLGTFFKSQGKWVDRFYHCIMPSDSHLLALIDEIGLSDQLYWKPTGMGLFVGGRLYPFNTAWDLLRFSPLSLLERLRFGVVSVMLRRLGKGKDLDVVTSASWLSRLYGKPIWENVWAPLYRSKFGDAVEEIPALYIWQRLGREKNNSVRGYTRCGHKGLIDALEKSIRSNGAEVRLSMPVASVDQRGTIVEVTLEDGEVIACDWVISTVPIPILRRMVEGGSLAQIFPDPGLRYQGVVNVLFFLSRPLSGHYWSPVLDSGTEFDGVIEMSTLVDVEQYAGRHLAYVVKYTDRGSALYEESDDAIASRWTSQLMRLFQDMDLSGEEIVETRVFRAPFVEPAYPLGYSRKKPSIKTGSSRVLLATTAQVYPNVTSWNSSVRLAGETVATLKAEVSPSDTRRM